MKEYQFSEDNFKGIMFKIHTEGGSAFVPEQAKLAVFLIEHEKHTPALKDALDEIVNLYQKHLISITEKNYMITDAVGLFYDGITLIFPGDTGDLIIGNRVSADVDKVLDDMNRENRSFNELAPLQKLILRMAANKEK